MGDFVMRRLRNEDVDDILSLWIEAFGDSEEVTRLFLQAIHIEKTGFGAFSPAGVLASMMFLIPAELRVHEQIAPCRYVYAVATRKEFRRKGLMRQLHALAAEEARAEGATALVLVPATPSLFSLYKMMGYRTRFFLGARKIVVTDNPSVVLTECLPEQFLNEREKLLNTHTISFDFSEEYQPIRFPLMRKTGASFFMVHGGIQEGYLCVEQTKEQMIILETNLTGQALSDACGALAKQTNFRQIMAIGLTGKMTPYGMILPFFSSKSEKIPFFIDAYMNLMLN